MNRLEFPPIPVEKKFSTSWFAELFDVSPDTIVRWFRDEAGVLHLGDESTNGKQARDELRIPYSVAMRVYAKRTRQRG